MNLKEELVKYQDKNGNFSGKKLKYSGIIEKLKQETSFLDDYNPSNRERIHCILNDITNIIVCPLTGEKLKYSVLKKEYVNNINYSRKNNKIRNKFDYKTKNENSWKTIVQVYNTNDFNTLSKEECLRLYKQHTVNKSAVISLLKAVAEIDLTCSIFAHTKFMYVTSLNLAERIYCIEGNINTIQLDYRGMPLQFRDRTSGYSIYADKKTMYKHKLDNAEDILSNAYTVNNFIHDLKDKGNLISRMSLTCNTCGYNFVALFKNSLWKKVQCPSCEGFIGRSKMEVQLVKFLKANGVSNISENNRQILGGGYELDIYLPDYKLAIELCGLTWHSFGTGFPSNDSEEKLKKYKHLQKYEKCKTLGIKLITVFEHEWQNKSDLVKSIVLNKLNKSSNKIFARKCRFDKVSSRESNNFLDINHIQGRCSYSEAYGLYYNNELVSLMCFGKRKLTRGQCEHELIRFCNKMNTSVVGGASKILKNSKVNNFISYCDLRYSDGNLYRTLGMKLLRVSLPNYYYTKNMKVFHRMNFQKHKISKSGDTRTEKQIMYENGYRRIYDCGNLVFEYRNTK